ncbi:MAG TPA: M13 family metallopeptidase [Pyrinomonadaceae bacterium]|nr:M13 family metallopeptidase [Pyrinomonadaceae bacterium]
MSQILKSFIALALAVSFGVSTILGQTAIHGYDRSNMDAGTQACTDFYQYANGGWLNSNPIPGAYPAWGVDNLLSERNRETLRQILEAAAKNTNAPRGSNEQKVGDFYQSCMDEQRIEAEGLKPLEPELALIAKINNVRDLQQEIAHLHAEGINAAFAFSSTQDFKNSDQVISGLFQGGLGMPDRDYYFKQDAKSKEIREAYVQHVAKMLELMGDAPATAAAEAQTILDFETKLADASLTRVELRDPNNLNNKITMAQLKALAPSIDWPNYLKGIGLNRPGDINVVPSKFFQRLNEQVSGVPLSDWKTYLRWNLINAAAPALSTPFVNEDFNFYSKKLRGTTEILPRWKRCVTSTDRALGEALGQLYVQRAFPPEAKKRALDMVHNLIEALRSDLQTLSWMSPATRQQAIIKLNAFIQKIGYPDRWRDYSSLQIDRSSYIMNRLRANRFENTRDVNKIGKPVDRAEWGMTPPTVNAYYNPQINEIVFPAGILQPPYFDPQADDAYNYGAMGAVIGHEMTHGFDDEGRQFDARGNLSDWWTADDRKAFDQRAACIIKQFDAFVVEGDLHENGQLVAGESIADLGGLVIAYAAFQKSMEGKPHTVIDGFTPEQRFFLGYAQSWATNIRPEYARLLANVDPHPLPKFRVNGPLANFPAFGQAFSCKASDAMVRAEADRCQIW